MVVAADPRVTIGVEAAYAPGAAITATGVEAANGAGNVRKRVGRRRTTGERGVVEVVGMVGPQPPLARRDSRPHPTKRFPSRLKLPLLSDASQIQGPGGD